MPTALSILELSKSYETKTKDRMDAIGSITFDVNEGEFVSVVGPSGCGKTTLLKIIAGLLEPSKGAISFFGVSQNNAMKNIGIVFQSPLLMPWRNALENVLLPIELLHKDKTKYLERAHDLIKLVGLAGFEEAFPQELSGGMQHRVAIARALMHDPDILLMDEPLAALDEMTREQMEIDLLRVWEDTKKTILLVTHNIAEAVLMSNKVVILSSRPAIVKKELYINLHGKRGLETRGDQTYVAYCQEVRHSLAL